MYPCPKDTLSIQAATLCWAVLPVLYSSSLLVMHVKCIQNSAHNMFFKTSLRPSEKPLWTHTQRLATPGLAGWVILVSIPTRRSIALNTPNKSQGPFAEHHGVPFAWNPGQICLDPSRPPYGAMSQGFQNYCNSLSSSKPSLSPTACSELPQGADMRPPPCVRAEQSLCIL